MKTFWNDKPKIQWYDLQTKDEEKGFSIRPPIRHCNKSISIIWERPDDQCTWTHVIKIPWITWDWMPFTEIYKELSKKHRCHDECYGSKHFDQYMKGRPSCVFKRISHPAKSITRSYNLLTAIGFQFTLINYNRPKIVLSQLHHKCP